MCVRVPDTATPVVVTKSISKCCVSSLHCITASSKLRLRWILAIPDKILPVTATGPPRRPSSNQGLILPSLVSLLLPLRPQQHCHFAHSVAAGALLDVHVAPAWDSPALHAVAEPAVELAAVVHAAVVHAAVVLAVDAATVVHAAAAAAAKSAYAV